MSEKPTKSAIQKDEELAELTDRILGGEPVEAADDAELHSLQQTVSRLNAMAQKTPPEDAMQRIEKRLVTEWHKKQNLPGAKLSYRQRLSNFLKSLGGGQPRALGLAVAVIVVLLIAYYPLSQLINPELEATAGGANDYQVFMFAGAVVVVIVLFLYGRRKS